MTENVHTVLLEGMHVLQSVVFYYIVLVNYQNATTHCMLSAVLTSRSETFRTASNFSSRNRLIESCTYT